MSKYLIPVKIGGAVLALAFASGVGYKLGAASAGDEIAEWKDAYTNLSASVQRAAIEASEAARADERRLIEEAAQINEGTTDELENAAADSDAADAVGLRAEVERLNLRVQRQRGENSTLGTDLATARAALGACTIALSQIDGFAGQCAPALQGARIRGLACEGQYQSVYDTLSGE